MPFEPFINSVVIHASAKDVWNALTQVQHMRQWMGQPEMELATDWQEDGPFIIIVPWYKSRMENKGVLVAYEPMRSFAYSHLSSLSPLADVAENYTSIAFTLEPAEDGTLLTLTVANFATEAIYRHLVFYWRVTMQLLKRYVHEGEWLIG